MVKYPVIYYFRWRDGFYTLFFVGEDDPFTREISQETFNHLGDFYPDSKLVDVKTVMLNLKGE